MMAFRFASKKLKSKRNERESKKMKKFSNFTREVTDVLLSNGGRRKSCKLMINWTVNVNLDISLFPSVVLMSTFFLSEYKRNDEVSHLN